MTDARPDESTMDGTDRDRPATAAREPRSDDLSEGELSERELGESVANAPAPTHLPESDVDPNAPDTEP